MISLSRFTQIVIAMPILSSLKAYGLEPLDDIKLRAYGRISDQFHSVGTIDQKRNALFKCRCQFFRRGLGNRVSSQCTEISKAFCLRLVW